MKKLILIGGGNLANKENTSIHQYMIDCSKNNKPKILYVSISKKNKDNFLNCMKDFNCEVKIYEKLEDIDSSDIIYLGGGNTELLIKETDLINKIYSKINEKIIVGISAGAIFWFEKYYSDSYAYNSGNGIKNYKLLDGLGYFKGYCCPHYNHDGKESFNDLVKDNFALALEDNTAIAISDEKIDIIKEKKENAVYYFHERKINLLDENNKEQLFMLLKNEILCKPKN